MNTHESIYPWIRSPLVVAAPMRTICLAPLAVEVSKAGGIGFIGEGSDLASLDDHLAQASSIVRRDQRLCQVYEKTGVLPVGFGVLVWGADLDLAIAAIKKWAPAAIWLFAPNQMQDFTLWTARVRAVTHSKTKIWIQIGTVGEALEVVRTCAPDVLVVQGVADAGGHGLEVGASIITLLPEVNDTLHEHGFSKIPLVAAGGIAEGRGAAAALVLGAAGVVLGTRLLATTEAEISSGYQKAVLEAKDGGINTVRTKVYDQLRGTTDWPIRYGGRSVINQTFLDHLSGLPIGENQKLYDEYLQKGDAGWGEQGRLTTYAGTAVGLIKGVKTTADVIYEVRQDAQRILGEASRNQRVLKSRL